MGLDKVKNEIISKANSEANAIINEGRKEAEKFKAKAEEQIREQNENIRKELKALTSKYYFITILGFPWSRISIRSFNKLFPFGVFSIKLIVSGMFIGFVESR